MEFKLKVSKILLCGQFNNKLSLNHGDQLLIKQ